MKILHHTDAMERPPLAAGRSLAERLLQGHFRTKDSLTITASAREPPA